MKSNPLTTALLGGLFVVAAMSAYFVLDYNLSYRKLMELQPKVVAYQNNRVILQALGGDLNEYSKQHPAIDAILIRYGMKAGISNAPAATTPKPAGK